jgi:hypothetical protein
MDPSDHAVKDCPHWAELQESMDNAAAGKVLPWRLALAPLPGPVFWVLFNWIAPWTWGRKIRRLSERQKEES